MAEMVNLEELERFYSSQLPDELSDQALLLATQVSGCILNDLVDSGIAHMAIAFWHTYYHLCQEELRIRGIKARIVKVMYGVNIMVTGKRAELWSDKEIREDFFNHATVETLVSLIKILSEAEPSAENVAALEQLHTLYCSRLN